MMSEQHVSEVSREINEAFENVHCDMHNLSNVLEAILQLNAHGVDTGDAAESLRAQIDTHRASLERYYAQLSALRDEMKAKAAEVADNILDVPHDAVGEAVSHDDGLAKAEEPATVLPEEEEPSHVAEAGDETSVAAEEEPAAEEHLEEPSVDDLVHEEDDAALGAEEPLDDDEHAAPADAFEPPMSDALDAELDDQ